MSIIPASPLPDVIRDRATEVLNYVLCAFFIAGYFAVAWALAFGPAKLHQSDSMKIVAGLGISWPAWGAIYLLCALLLTNHRSRVGGFFLGACLVTFYLGSYLYSIHEGHPGSAPGLFAGYAAILSQVSGLARSAIAAEWRRS